jgi:hypothetical protein
VLVTSSIVALPSGRANPVSIEKTPNFTVAEPGLIVRMALVMTKDHFVGLEFQKQL